MARLIQYEVPLGSVISSLHVCGVQGTSELLAAS
jgi:hypothetical protein